MTVTILCTGHLTVTTVLNQTISNIMTPSISTYFAVAAPEADVAAVAEWPRVRGQADAAPLARIPQTVVHVCLPHVLTRTNHMDQPVLRQDRGIRLLKNLSVSSAKMHPSHRLLIMRLASTNCIMR
jgi:hypothetical protein